MGGGGRKSYSLCTCSHFPLTSLRSTDTGDRTLGRKYRPLLTHGPVLSYPVLSEVAAPWTEETVKQCLYLYLALLPQNHKLIHELAAVYTEAIADIKRTVLRVIEQPVRLLAHLGRAESPSPAASWVSPSAGAKGCHLDSWLWLLGALHIILQLMRRRRVTQRLQGLEWAHLAS